eukprot:jgi/Mesvir1/23964/Mv10730-RA.1
MILLLGLPSQARDMPGSQDAFPDDGRGCILTSPCSPCGPEEKVNEAYCQATGYKQELECLASEDKTARIEGVAAVMAAARKWQQPETQTSRKKARKRKGGASAPEGSSTEDIARVFEEGLAGDWVNNGDGERANRGEGDRGGGEGSSPRSDAGDSMDLDNAELDLVTSGLPQGSKVLQFQSCEPPPSSNRKRMSLFTFECFMLALLALAAPVVLHRRHRRALNLSVALTAMNRGGLFIEGAHPIYKNGVLHVQKGLHEAATRPGQREGTKLKSTGERGRLSAGYACWKAKPRIRAVWQVLTNVATLIDLIGLCDIEYA